MPSQFCPARCLFAGVDGMCNVDCMHSKDKVFKEPQSITIKTASGWQETKIIGRNESHLYLADGTSVGVDSALIKLE